MDVVSACCATPYDLFLLGLEFHKADRAVTFDCFSLSIIVIRLGFLFAAEGGGSENLTEFLPCMSAGEIGGLLDWCLPMI